MHSLGLVHRNLSPDVIFQSFDEKRPFFIGDHFYTTEIPNGNQNMNMPNNIYMIRSAKWKGGTKKQDLNALGGIIMAWAIGIDTYAKLMRSRQDRLAQAYSFSQDTSYHPNLREIVRRTLLEPDSPLKIT